MLVNGSDFYCGSGNGITTQIAKFSDLDSLKTSVSNGKSLIASAITDKGISTASDVTFQTMANNISQLDIRQHAKLVISVVDVDGTPLVGYKIDGLTGVDSSKCITQSGGIVSLTDVWGTFYCTVPDAECIDAYMPQTTISLADGETKSVEMRMVSRGVNELSITESKNIKFSNNVKSVDVFCVGGGASGGTGNGASSGGSYSYGNGGSGGFTKTVFAVTIVPHKLYSAIIGKGGASPTSYSHSGNPGESSSFLGVEAAGGSSTSGGSGGGAGGYIYFTKNSDYYYNAGVGGSDGSSGGDSTDYRGRLNSSGIAGQGTTTRAFGQSSGALYSGGGGGGYISKTSGGAGGGGDGAYSKNNNATNGTPNTGGGGGGGYCSQLNAGSGGSGIILCRLNLKS